MVTNTPGEACHAYIVPLSHSSITSELSFVSNIGSNAVNGHSFIFTADSAPVPSYHMEDQERFVRELQSTTLYTKTGNILINADIFTGLVITLFLAFIVCNLYCFLIVYSCNRYFLHNIFYLFFFFIF